MWLEEEPTERKPEQRDREQKSSAAETPPPLHTLLVRSFSLIQFELSSLTRKSAGTERILPQNARVET